MIRVMIIEDEPIHLRSIKRMVEESHSDFKVVAEALNGLDALEMIQSASPDVVFTDIKMPLMDGLTFLDELQKLDIKPISVVISGYQDFDYAKRAIKLDVVDYLLKPILLDELKNLIHDIYDRLESTKKESQLTLLKKIIFREYSICCDDFKFHDFRSYPEFAGMYICSGSYFTFPNSCITPAIDFWVKNNLIAIIKKHLPPEYIYWILDAENGNEKILVLSSLSGLGTYYFKVLEEIFTDLSDNSFPITAIMIKRTAKINELAVLIKQAKLVINKNIIFGKSNFIVFDMPDFKTKELKPFDINYSKSLFPLIKNRQSEQLKIELKKMMVNFEKFDCLQVFLENFLKSFIGLFTNVLEFIPQSKIVEINIEINELISNSISYQSLYQGICFIIDDLLCTKIEKPIIENGIKGLAAEIDNYINLNYANQISIQTLAEKFGVVPEHFIRSYKKYKGTSPGEQITILRISKAKELLKVSPPMLMQDIAEAVGYNDPLYFSRIFKSVTGKSPSIYRIEGV